MMSYKKKSGVYMVDFSNLNAVDQDDTPRVSQRCTDDKRRFEAKQSADLRRKISSNSCYLKVRDKPPKNSEKFRAAVSCLFPSLPIAIFELRLDSESL